MGVILYELRFGYPPFFAENVPQLFELILSYDFDFPTERDSMIESMLEQLLCPLEKRMSLERAVTWARGVKVCDRVLLFLLCCNRFRRNQHR